MTTMFGPCGRLQAVCIAVASIGSALLRPGAAHAEFTWSEDFDTLPLGAYSSPYWTNLPGTVAAGIAVTDSTATSLPNSLQFDPSLIGAGTANYNSIEAGMVFDPGLAFTPTEWEIEFDLRRDMALDDSLFELVGYDAEGDRRALIALGDYGIGPSVINISFGTFAEANLPYEWGEWVHVYWKISFYGDGTGFQRVRVDDYPFSFLPISDFEAPITSFGFVFRDPDGEYSGSAFVDNLSFTAIPSPPSIVLIAVAGLAPARRRR